MQPKRSRAAFLLAVAGLFGTARAADVLAKAADLVQLDAALDSALESYSAPVAETNARNCEPT